MARAWSPPTTKKRRSILLLALVVIAMACVILWSRQPAGRLTVVTQTPKLGVHTRLTDEVEDWKISRTFEMVREMGASWVVEYFPWSYVEQSRDSYDWSHVDKVVDAAYRQGLTLIARIDAVPVWARPEASPSRLLPAESYDDYAEFLALFAKRYQGKVSHIIVWNEPNLSFEWGFRKPSPSDYTALLRQTYPKIKEANPNITVLAAGLAPVVESTDLSTSDLDYLRGMYEAGASDYFDALAGHAYGWTKPAEDAARPEKVNFERLLLQRDIMERNGDGNKPIYITEAGWNDHPRWTKAVRPGQRIEYSVEALRMAEAWPWCSSLAFWNFRLPRPSYGYNDYYTFVTQDFEPKPIYEALQAIALTVVR